MATIFRVLLGAFMASVSVQAHMGISGLGVPNSQSRAQRALGDPYRYPNVPVCHGIDTVGTVTQLQAGTTYRPTMSFGAGHEGGHCVWAVSTDMNTWYKINDVKDCTLGTDHALPIPTNLPVQCETGSCILSWFWTPRQSGSCEIYQNCFDIKVTQATGGIETSNPSFIHGKNRSLNCQRVDNSDHITPHYGTWLGEDGGVVVGGGGGGGAPPTPKPTAFPTPFPTVPSTTRAPTPHNDECVSHNQLIDINGESSYWPRCDPSQPIKANALRTGYEFGLYCTRAWTTELNDMLKSLGYCKNPEIIRNFLAQTVYETGYFSTLGQPLDNGSGIIHMIPANWEPNVRDMETLFPGRGILAEFNSRNAEGKKQFFQEPEYAWLSAAAWFKSTNRVIGGCGKDLFPLTLDDQTKCILGRVVSRSQALELVSKHIPLDTDVEVRPPTQRPTTPPTNRPTTRPPTARPTVPPTVAGSGGGGSTVAGCEAPAFDETTTYWKGDMVVYEGSLYTAGYWSQGDLPTSGGAFSLTRACDTSVAQICGGVGSWSKSVAYKGGALVSYEDKVYVAKWWSRTTPPPEADSWAYQKDCETVVAEVADIAEVDGDTTRSTSKSVAPNTASTVYATFMQFTVHGVQSDDLRLLPAIVEDFKVLMDRQYSVFFPLERIKDVDVAPSGANALTVIVELHFDSFEDASDAAAVLKTYEEDVMQSFKRLAIEQGVKVTEIEVKSQSGVVAVETQEDRNGPIEASGSSAVTFSTTSALVGASLYALLMLC